MTSEAYAVTVPKGYRVGAWEVREPIATGAFGSVYEARRVGDDDQKDVRGDVLAGGADAGPPEDLPRTAALKFLPTGTGTPRHLAHLRELVDRELKLHRRLKRHRLIRMYETLTVDDPARPNLDGAVVLVLEKAEESLSALLTRTQGPPPEGPALLAEICEGLAQLHRAGWVHGDLKPANVLLMKDGSARLADFNMAAELEGTHAYTPAFSTPDYTPPELLWSEIGERGRRIRPSADIWAFGVLAHLVLTDSFPLPGGTPTARRDAAAAYARGTDELRLSPGLPDAWREIVRDCLTRTHEERIGGEALLRRVEAAAGTRSARRLPRLRGRSRRALVASAAVVTAAVAVLGYGIGTWAGDDPKGGGTGTGTNISANAQTSSAENVDFATYGAAELRTDKGVPPAYRGLIVDSAHSCADPYVTPALLAAMLKVESNFDPNLSDPDKDEYGIARWTPRVLKWWLRADGTAPDGIPGPPFPPEQSIPAMGRYLCWIASRLDEKPPPGDRRVLISAGYRTSYEKVDDAAGVPPKVRPYADRVAHYLKEYTAPGKK